MFGISPEKNEKIKKTISKTYLGHQLKSSNPESFTKNMGRGEGASRELPDGWIDFDQNSVTYNLSKHVCNL